MDTTALKYSPIWQTSSYDGSVKELEVMMTGMRQPHTKEEVFEVLQKCKSHWPEISERQKFSPKFVISLPYMYCWDQGYMILFTNRDTYIKKPHSFECEGERAEYILD